MTWPSWGLAPVKLCLWHGAFGSGWQIRFAVQVPGREGVAEGAQCFPTRGDRSPEVPLAPCPGPPQQ